MRHKHDIGYFFDGLLDWKQQTVVCLATPASPTKLRCVASKPTTSGQELFQKSSCRVVTCHRVTVSVSCHIDTTIPWRKEKKLLSLSCFRNVRKLLFLHQIYHALRALILQKKYQKKYKKYTVKFLLLAVALHQLLRARCGRCGHAINSSYDKKSHVELEAERLEMFFRIQRIRCLSFRSCQRLNEKGLYTTTNVGKVSGS